MDILLKKWYNHHNNKSFESTGNHHFLPSNMTTAASGWTIVPIILCEFILCGKFGWFPGASSHWNYGIYMIHSSNITFHISSKWLLYAIINHIWIITIHQYDMNKNTYWATMAWSLTSGELPHGHGHLGRWSRKPLMPWPVAMVAEDLFRCFSWENVDMVLLFWGNVQYLLPLQI